MYSNLLFLFFLIFLSCNSIDNLDVNKLDTPCECLDAKIEIYQKLNIFFENHFDSIPNKNISTLDLDLVDEFSVVFNLSQKLDDIDFKIQLNQWTLDVQDCSKYLIYQSLNKKFIK